MASIDLKLGVKDVRALIRNLKELSRQLKDDVVVDIERGVAEDVAQEIRENIASISDLDGNLLGAENPNASVTVVKDLPGHAALWRGKQIAFLEYGTGAEGARDAYPGTYGGVYHPDPTKESWVYFQNGPHLSVGLGAEAPVYYAGAELRVTKRWKLIATPIIGKALNDAVTL